MPETGYIAPVRSPGQCVGAMPNKPRRRATPPAHAANDNKSGVRPLPRYVWDVYRAAARPRWVGQVIAADVTEAIEAAAVEYPYSGGCKTDVKKLIAVRRWEVAS
jgi:hypothetical protein